MTNEQLQSVIRKGDICSIDGGYYEHTKIYCKFVGFDRCKWQTSIGYDSCSKCKGRMTFESDAGVLDTKCHSHGGSTKENYTDVTIILKLGQILPKELFEI